MQQANFFPLVGGPEVRYRVFVNVQLIDDHWQATIADGWWMAWGETEAEAIRRVKRRYEQSRQSCHPRNLKPPKWFPVTDAESGQVI